MSDDEDTDLENLRQLALSSLLKKKSVPLQNNAVFYRPVSNSNLISIQPVKELDGEEDNEEEKDGIEEEENDAGSSSGSEYAVIEEGLSVSSGDVDQVIEEIIVSGEEGNDSEEEEAEDAISIASHDSFDEILNSVEEEIRGSKRRPSTGGINNPGTTNGPNDSKRPRPDVVPVERKEPHRGITDRRVRSRSPAFRDSYQREHEKMRQGNRKPGSPNYHRNRRSKSPRNLTRHRSPLLNRRTSKSPTENRKPKPQSYPRRKSPSPITLRRSEGGGITTGRDYQRQVRRKPSSRPQNGSDSEKPSSQRVSTEEVRGQYNNNRRRSAERRRSRSPPSKLSFGDHRLRTRVRQSKNPSSRNPSRQTSRERTRSPVGKRQERTTKSPERKQSASSVKTRSPSPSVDISNLTPDERMRLEKRKLKFQSKASGSGKVILKPKENTSENHAKVPKVPITFDSTVKTDGLKRKTSTTNSNPISSRLGQVLDPEKEGGRRDQNRHDERPKSKSVTSKSKQKDSSRDVEDFSNNNNSKRPSGTSTSPPKTVGEDDLRTKLQQKRANANVGRIFTVALKDTIHKDTSVSPRN